MNIRIKNCNSIDSAEISIELDKLNIRYGVNGTGKSTIAKCLALAAEGEDIGVLCPFKHRSSTDEATKPFIQGAESLSSVLVFNEDYVRQFVFQADEVIANSFNIFVRTPEYEAHLAAIEAHIKGIKDSFNDSGDLNKLIADLQTLSGAFGRSKDGWAASGAWARGPGMGNRVVHIPEGLEDYKLFIQSDDNVKWLKWQMEGTTYSSKSDTCPFCTSLIETKRGTIEKVRENYDAKAVEHINNVSQVVGELGKYFTDDTRDKISALTRSAGQISTEERAYLVDLRRQVDLLLEKCQKLRFLSFSSMKDAGKISTLLEELRIKIEFFTSLNSDSTRAVIDPINAKIVEVLADIGSLQGEVGKQKSAIARTIKANKDHIDLFLRSAGYKYSVDIEPVGEEYRLKLFHVDAPDAQADGSAHLSFGERNALSLVLFMFDCLAKNPGLIILDDPISSFDRSKKFAVVEMLFRGARSLRGRTVLMLTHDLEPVIDMGHTLAGKFMQNVTIAFLENQKGLITETEIKKDDIMTFGEVCKANIAGATDDVHKVIYLRRFLEITEPSGIPYQLLSSLIHKRVSPDKRIGGATTLLTAAEIAASTAEISVHIPGFDYGVLQSRFADDTQMVAAYKAAGKNYEKLQIFRVIKDGDLPDNEVLAKFINEVFHIENDFVMQVNPLSLYLTT
jgi:ABC-type Mn2+/Zn2+ transport system ATPase subunit